MPKPRDTSTKTGIHLDLLEAEGDAPAALKVTLGDEGLRQLAADQATAATHVYSVLEALGKDLEEFFPQVPEPLPPRLEGQLLEPDGTPAAGVMVEVEPPGYASKRETGSLAWPRPHTLTDARGAFGIDLPRGPLPDSGLTLTVSGAANKVQLLVKKTNLTADGQLGTLPLPASTGGSHPAYDIVAAIPQSAADVVRNPRLFAGEQSFFTLGEGDCARSFRSNAGVIDTFRYGTLIRLVAPRVHPQQTAISSFSSSDPQTMYEYAKLVGGLVKLVDRTPVSGPIDITAFIDKVSSKPGTVPKASSLGLGYVVHMEQTWIPAGLSLGDLVYSLPLAPGEQQRIAVFEQHESMAVLDSESLSIDERQAYAENADTSTQAVFSQAYRESAYGESQMSSKGSSKGVGVAYGNSSAVGSSAKGSYGAWNFLGGFAGMFSAGLSAGYGSSSSSGSTSGSQSGSRDYTSSAAEQFHSQLSRTAAASRRANRTGMRMATASDSQQLTTTVITNHNHCHALTMQYWQVLRHFTVSSVVDDVQLVCFVPFEIVQFLPSNHPQALPAAGGTYAYDRPNMLARYKMLLRHLDVLDEALGDRGDYRYGLRLLREFASEPTMGVATPAQGTVTDDIQCEAIGAFVPQIEDVFITLFSKTGARVGPIKMSPVGGATSLSAGTFNTAQEVTAFIQSERASGQRKMTATFSLPSWIARGDIARFELSRSFRPFSILLAPIAALSTWTFLEHAAARRAGIASFQASELEAQAGGPTLTSVTAKIVGTTTTVASGGNGEPMGTTYPISAFRLPPRLSYGDLLHIESVFQHVVANTTQFSTAVWASLTAEERAIMLEPFTIGIPTAGFTGIPSGTTSGPTTEVPLLDCVANQVLGFYGNCAVMPFFIPPQVASVLSKTSRDIQEALLKFHRDGFMPPRSSITLPARGLLGEAVLGDCCSCEKIDLTRFWNWQDSPADSAADLRPADFTAPTFAGMSGPSELTGATTNQTLLNITGAAPAGSSALSSLIEKAPALAAFENLTAAAALQALLAAQTTAASEAESGAVAAATDVTKTLATSVADVLKTALKQQEKTDEPGGNGGGDGGGSGEGGGEGGGG
jgi:hypothetical protein